MRIQLALRDEVAPIDVDNALLDLDWTVLDTIPRSPRPGRLRRWDTGMPGTVAEHIDDTTAAGHHIRLIGPEAAAAAEIVHGTLSTWRRADILAYADWATAREDRVRAVQLLGIVAPEALDRDVCDRLSAAAGSSDVAVREAVVTVAAALLWPEMDALLDGIGRDDAAAPLRERAAAHHRARHRTVNPAS